MYVVQYINKRLHTSITGLQYDRGSNNLHLYIRQGLHNLRSPTTVPLMELDGVVGYKNLRSIHFKYYYKKAEWLGTGDDAKRNIRTLNAQMFS